MHVPAVCSRCSHGGESHIYCDGLAAYCAMGPRSHAAGLACSFYAPRTVPRSGARCRTPGCECFDRGGYLARERKAG
jgi:hypothetical protein